MTFLEYYRVGRTTIPRYVPLRVAVRLRTEEGRSSIDLDEDVARPSLRLVRSEMAQGRNMEMFEFEPSQASSDGRFLFEVPTEQFTAGAFELYIEAGEEEQLQLPEEVWILEEDDYRALVDETSEEEFLPSPGLHGGREVVRYVANLIKERLDEDDFQRDGFAGSRFRVSMPEGFENIRNSLFPSSPIRWTTQQVVAEFRELALYGVADVRWTLVLSSQRYGLQCDGELLDPLSGDAGESFSDLRNSQLALLKRSKDLQGLELDQKIQYDSRRFTLEASHSIDNFEPICPMCGRIHREHP